MTVTLRAVDWLWHHGPYQLTVRWADRLHLFMYRQVCTPVAAERQKGRRW